VFVTADWSTVLANVFAGISTVAGLASVFLAWRAIAETRAQQREGRLDAELRLLEGLILPLANLQLAAVAAQGSDQALTAYMALLESLQVRLVSLPDGNFPNCRKLTQPSLPPDQAIALCEPALHEVRAAIASTQQAAKPGHPHSP
jgi:hypothetical protein